MQERYTTRIHEGMDVLDTDGEKIGKCGETLGDSFTVDAGFLGTTEYYVPFSAITEVTDDTIVLDVRKDQLDTLGWTERPAATTAGASTATTTGAATTTDTEQTLQLREEQLQARKTPVETGRVELGKEVVEEQRRLEVPVTREEVYVERRPVERQPSDQPIGETQTEAIRVPVREEQVEVEKRPVVYEEVGVGKRVSQETRRVADTVRREELRTDNQGEVEVRNDPTP